MACFDVVEQHAQIVQGMIESLIQEREELQHVRDGLSDIIVGSQETQQDNENVSGYSQESDSDFQESDSDLDDYEEISPYEDCDQEATGTSIAQEATGTSIAQEATGTSIAQEATGTSIAQEATGTSIAQGPVVPKRQADLSIPPISAMQVDVTEDWTEDDYPPFYPNLPPARNCNGCPCCHARNTGRCGCPGLPVQVRSFIFVVFSF